MRDPEKAREYQRRYKLAHRDRIAASRKRWAKANPTRIDGYRMPARARLDFLIRILKSGGCVDCGEKNQVILDFDHVDPATKTREIAELRSRNCSVARMVQEVAKCEVRCANCHRRRTASMRAVA